MADADPTLGAVRHGYAPHGDQSRWTPPPTQEPLADHVSGLIDQARSTIEAEKQLMKARVAVVGDGAKRTSVAGAIALLFGLLSAIALTVGLVLTLATLVGPGWATLIVTAAMGLIALIFALSAKRAMTETSDALKTANGEDRGIGNE